MFAGVKSDSILDQSKTFFSPPVPAAGFEPLIIGICVNSSTTVLPLPAYKTHFTVSYYYTVSYIPNSHLMVEIRVHLQSRVQPKAGFNTNIRLYQIGHKNSCPLVNYTKVSFVMSASE